MEVSLDIYKPREYQIPPFRAMEKQKIKRAILCWPRRCLSGDSEILLANGSVKLLKDIKIGDEILSWNGESFVVDRVKDFWKTEVKETYLISSDKYPSIVSSKDHLFATDKGVWTKVSNIRDEKVLQYGGGNFGTVHNPDLAEFIGYMCSDGYVSGQQQPKFTNANPDILDRVEFLAYKLFQYKPVWRKKGNCYDLGLTNGSIGGGTYINKIKELFRQDGKDIPKRERDVLSCVWDFDEESLGRFFAALLSCDGSLYYKNNDSRLDERGRKYPITFDVAISLGQCDAYAKSIYWLLRKFGVAINKPIKEKGSNWKLRIYKGSFIKKILSYGKIYGKEERQKEILDIVSTYKNTDELYHGSYLTKVKIESHKPIELYDIETERYHNFVANGYVVHNSGKDITAWNFLVRQAIQKVGVYFAMYPTYSQGKKIVWDTITNEGLRFIDFIPPVLIKSTNSQEMKIYLINGSLIQVVGSENIHSLVGTNPIGIVFSEYALQNGTQAYQFMRPILAANDGWCIFISTPRGKNFFYDLYKMAIEQPTWYVSKLTLDDTKHVPLEEIENDRKEGRLSEDLIQQEYYCFPADQEVLCVDSLKPIKDIVINDMVISHSGRSRKVIGLSEREYEGELVEIISYGSPEPIRCTPNHPIRVYEQITQTYSWKPAGEITIEDRLFFPKITPGTIPLISYELCMLMAWYITEGSSFKNGIQFTVGPDSEVERIVYLLGKLNIESAIYKKDNCSNVVVNSVQLVDFFKVNCGTEANNKRIPMTLISTYENDFFMELIAGDGCVSVHDGHLKYVYTTVSKFLAYQVQILAHSLNKGYAAGLTKRLGKEVLFPHGKTYMCQDSYVVSIFVKGLRIKDSFLIRSKYGVCAKIKSINRTQFAGKVYNFSVQYDESYIVAGRAVHNCSFEMGVEGAYYSKNIDRMRVNGQITEVPWECNSKVWTAWDLGMRDNTTIIFFQNIGTTIRIIDCYSNCDVGLEHYAKVLEKKPYIYGGHIAPHDIKVRELGTGVSRLETARRLGISFTLAPDLSIQDGIESVRNTLNKVYIDKSKCTGLIDSLESYRKEYDHRHKVYRSQPLHNSHSHYADAMRYLCISQVKTSDGMSKEDIDRARSEALGVPRSRSPLFD